MIVLFVLNITILPKLANRPTVVCGGPSPSCLVAWVWDEVWSGPVSSNWDWLCCFPGMLLKEASVFKSP